ncbi:ABC transporter ATP-binding protein [Pyrodictium abyssi]|uniref:ABC transporter ATP-binding protein n=1 Tax=Pyrodictium abyssi TaxID=54256 RepID=A0ABN6ZPY9_9CREN|nr:ABC transporter ATP-binding protein [Pyrodictium abyssi]
MGLAVVFENVWKIFPGGAAALQGASFSIPEGALAGIVGPNGSGKTTSLRLAMGFATPTRGRVEVLGVVPWNSGEVRARIGYLPERPVYPLNVSVEKLLVHGARLLGLPDPYGEARRWARVVGLTGYLSARIGSLSRGYLQRLGLAYALLGEPELMLLDEPTTNLDPAARLEILDLIRSIGSDLSTTIVVSTHILPEMQRVANYLVVLVQGRVAVHGPLPELVKRYRAEGVYEISTAPRAARRAAARLIAEDVVRGVEVVGDSRLLVKARPGPEVEELLSRLKAEGLVESYTLRTGSIEQLYVSITGGGA